MLGIYRGYGGVSSNPNKTVRILALTQFCRNKQSYNLSGLYLLNFYIMINVKLLLPPTICSTFLFLYSGRYFVLSYKGEFAT